MTRETETTVLPLEAKEHKEGQRMPEAGMKDCPLEPSGGTRSCHTWIWDPLPLEQGDDKLLLY